MRAILFFVLVFMISIYTASSQYYYIPATINPTGNPGNLNTDFEDPLGGGLAPGWVCIDPLSNSPAWSAVQNIPFPFQFNGDPVTSYKVSNTGILTFTTTATTVPGQSNDILPHPSIPDKSVCIWGIAYTGVGSNDHIVKKTFGTAPNRQHWIQFNSYNVPSPSWCWLYYAIVLEETTNNIYVVDQRCNRRPQCRPMFTIGVQVNSTVATMVAGSPNLGALAGTSKTPVDNRYYTFIHGHPPTRDVGVNWLQIGNFLILNQAPFEFKGKVKNYTSHQVNNYDINYSVNDGPVYTAHMTGAAHTIPGYGEEWFIHDSLWTPPGVGVYNFKFWATNINGGDDQNPSNDTLFRTIEVSTAFTPKMRLFEMFTSSTCTTSKDANDSLHNVLSLYPETEYAMIKYPMNFPGAGDPYFTLECEDRRTYYGVDSIPEMYVHGDELIDPLYIDTTQFNFLWDRTYIMFSSPSYTLNGNDISVSAPILPFEDFPQNTLQLRIALVEKVTTGNVGTNGETEFYNTFHKFIPDADGISLGPLSQAVYKTVTRNYTIPAQNNIENWSNISVILFIQDDATKEVLQAAYAQFQSSIDDKEMEKAIVKLVPNPAQNTTTIYYVINEPSDISIDIFNMNGQLARSINYSNQIRGVHQCDLDISDLRPGLYLVRLNNGSTIETKRLIIK